MDRNDLFTSLSNQRLSNGQSIRVDFMSITFDLQAVMVQVISWIPGEINRADILTEKESAINDALQLCLKTGKLPADHDK